MLSRLTLVVSNKHKTVSDVLGVQALGLGSHHRRGCFGGRSLSRGCDGNRSWGLRSCIASLPGEDGLMVPQSLYVGESKAYMSEINAHQVHRQCPECRKDHHDIHHLDEVGD